MLFLSYPAAGRFLLRPGMQNERLPRQMTPPLARVHFHHSPFFVTLEKRDSPRSREYSLRGCIGTLSARSIVDLGAFALKRCGELLVLVPYTAPAHTVFAWRRCALEDVS